MSAFIRKGHFEKGITICFLSSVDKVSEDDAIKLGRRKCKLEK